MSFNERIEITLPLLDELQKDLPGTLDDLQLTVRPHLANEVDHLRHDDADLMPVKVKLCPYVVRGNEQRLCGPNLPGTCKNVREPPASRIQPFVSVPSIRLIFHMWLKSLRYFTIASESMTVSMGESTLYSSVKTSQPISPCEYSSIRASSLRSTSGESFCAFEERMADSRVAVRLCR